MSTEEQAMDAASQPPLANPLAAKLQSQMEALQSKADAASDAADFAAWTACLSTAEKLVRCIACILELLNDFILVFLACIHSTSLT